MKSSQKLKQSNKVRQIFIPVPRKTGVTAIVLALYCSIFGIIFKEIVLLLLGLAIAVVLLYCFAAILILFLLQWKKCKTIKPVSFTTSNILNSNDNISVMLPPDTKNFFSAPALLVRYQITMYTKDRPFKRIFRSIFPKAIFSKNTNHSASMQSDDIKELQRGAYYSSYDEIIFFDIFNFFSLVYKIYKIDSSPLLVIPQKKEMDIEIFTQLNGSETKSGSKIKSQNIMNDSRPYIPGDDPRRINWKLYGHIGELFVRENERENKLFSDAAFFIDTAVYTGIYNKHEYNTAIDRLCSALYAIFQKGIASGIIIHAAFKDENHDISYSELTNQDEIQTMLAFPYAIASDNISKERELPDSKIGGDVFTVTLSCTNKYTLNIERGGVCVYTGKI